MVRRPKLGAKMRGARVLITKGPYAGCEGVCLGPQDGANIFAVSPDGSNEIVDLRFEEEFGLLIDLSSDAASN